MNGFKIFVDISGVIICIVLFLLYRSNYITKYIWVLFWVGFSLGLIWEIPLCLIPAPFPPALSTFSIMISASFWDGGFFLLGYLFVILICKEPYFDKVNIRELSVLLIYSQICSLIVEMLAIAGGGWEYPVTPWNPLLFKFLGGNITLGPQLIWFIAPIAFYFIALKLKPRFVELENKEL